MMPATAATRYSWMLLIGLTGVASYSSSAVAAQSATIQKQCDAIIKNENSSRFAMIEAGLLYYHGMQMGQKCVNVNYAEAFRLLRLAKDSNDYFSLLSDLKLKAASGNPKAAAALEKVDASPILP